MAALSNHVSISITQDSVGIKLAGFGIPLILSATAAWATDKIRFYGSLDEVADDFATTTSAEYLAAHALFSQNPAPESIAIGKTASTRRPTMRYRLTPVVTNSHAYTFTLKGDGVTSTDISYTSDASATAQEIVEGLTTAVNAVVGKNFTATEDDSILTITGDSAGEWFAVDDVSSDDFALVCDHADPGVATDLAAINVVDNTWYCLITLYNSDAYVKAAAAWVEANKKIYIADMCETEAITDAADGTQGTLDDLATLGYARTAGVWHNRPSEMIAAAWAGDRLPLDAGSETWKFAQLSGVSAPSITSTQRTNLVNRSANFYESVAGVSIMSNGTTADGGFIDTRRGLDWIESDMSAGIFTALAGANKVPYTNAGIAVVEAQVRATLLRAVKRQIIADDPAFTVTVPRVADVSSADKTARILRNVKFSATLAGAIHSVVVSGVVSV